MRIVESIASGQSPVFRRWMGLSPDGISHDGQCNVATGAR
ncbi:hypothetical protein HMPREF3196_00326 [Bifidobacterium bifidum]|uniref:Uncharacterized protein n=1 Tax=Bifidobacterium bifidum TaxID=1681 RepID=A0A133KSF8_BIFBI|nr:hypothetical protein HMPREF3196_00326 [Bifidobacterium bifidum]